VFVALVALLRIGSRIACLFVIASFGLFVIDQASSASTHQQEAVNGTNGGPTSTPASSSGKEDEAHKVIDEVAGKLTSPFSGITANSTSQWVIRGVGTVMALLVYGVGFGFLARFLRLRA
jgi:hypothetical protein